MHRLFWTIELVFKEVLSCQMFTTYTLRVLKSWKTNDFLTMENLFDYVTIIGWCRVGCIILPDFFEKDLNFFLHVRLAKKMNCAKFHDDRVTFSPPPGL